MTSPVASSPTPTPSFAMRGTDKINASTLMKAKPTHHQKVYKLKVPAIYTFTPAPLLTCLQYTCFPLLLLCNIKLKPHWVERYIIVVGNYLYKFQPKNSLSPGQENMKMKGSPIPLGTMTSTTLQQQTHGIVSSTDKNKGLNDTFNGLDSIPTQPSCSGYFSINSNSKTSYYATDSQLDAQTWINVLHTARQECITQNMGHSKIPISREVEYVNMMGKNIVERKKRISDLMKKKELEEVEMMCLNGGSSNPRGYYG